MFHFAEIPKDSREVKGSLTVDAKWIDAYSDPSSTEFKVFSRSLVDYLTEIFKNSYHDDFIGVEVKNFRKGSVQFDFIAYFKITSSVSEENLEDVLMEGKGSSGFKIIDVDALFTAAEKPETGFVQWIIILIPIGTVFVFFVVIVVIFMVSHLYLLPNACFYRLKLFLFSSRSWRDFQTVLECERLFPQNLFLSGLI